MRAIYEPSGRSGAQRNVKQIDRRLVRRSVRPIIIGVIVLLVVGAGPVSSSKAQGSVEIGGGTGTQIYGSFAETVTLIANWLAEKSVHEPPTDTASYEVTSSVPVTVAAPTTAQVTDVSSTSVTLNWTPPTGSVTQYQVERSLSVSGTFLPIGNTTGSTYIDTSASYSRVYFYRVRAVGSDGTVSAPSNLALGVAISFEFNQLGGQTIKAQHIYDIRTAVNALREAANKPLFSWKRSNLAGLNVEANDILEIRTALDEALTALNIQVLPYQDSALDANTVIKAIHIEQLQTRATRGTIGSSPVDLNTSDPRLDPMNETGGGGENPLSRNFNLNLPLLNLPGRAGMDLGLALSYNSLIWTKHGTQISFDDDHGFPGPGFRLGFPVIQPLPFNSEVGKKVFLLIGPDGSHTELRQVGTSALYEAADSSHLLLDSDAMVLRTTDGTQMSYVAMGSDYNCTQIKDRNGNFISINYVSGQIDNIVDTLGRSIKFNYTGGWLTSITQVWNGVTHNWAVFTYTDTTIGTNFTGLTNNGPANGVKIKTLSRVTLADGSYTVFEYSSWGQVWKVSEFAADNHLLNYRTYNLPQDATASQTDCPRFTERRDWAQYWNGDTDGTVASTEEAVTTFAVPVSDVSWNMPDGTSQSGTRAQVTAPDGTSDRIYFIGKAGDNSGWQRGLAALVVTYDSGGSLQRQAMTTWTQDNTALPYILNPRVSETNIYDPAGNRARTRIAYQPFTFTNGTSCQLPRDVFEYAADPTTVLRSTRTDYNTSASYTDRRILGLVSEKRLYEGDVTDSNTSVLASRIAFNYDESGSIQGTDAPVQHDTNYNAAFVTGRGNLSSANRYDVTPNSSQFTTTGMQYNTAGAVVSSKDALNHGVTISYADSFSDGNNTRNTLAYPTKLTDPDGYYATSQYNFDFGALTSRQTPPSNFSGAPADQPAGPVQKFAFDDIGRLQRQTNVANGAYTRFEYPASQNRVDTYATIQDDLGEAHSFALTDGAGRVIAAAIDHPGSVGGSSGQRTVYDVMGRVIKTSNPTETHALGAPSEWDTVGDDASAGWIYMQQTYDWKGRLLVTTNQDGTTKTLSYTGCGCAGGNVVTLTDEMNRQRKVYSDVLGRTWKVEMFNWPDANQNRSVYSTTVSVYNARDQVTSTKEYPGDTTTAFQETTTTYDGYGRIKAQHSPQMQADPTNILSSDHVTYDYFDDNSVKKVTDARGATTSFLNNGRRLVYSVHYTAPSGISVPADVTYTYDAAGNRTSMKDGFGRTDYSYNSLSQLTSEARQFADLSGTYTLSYTYSLSGLLKSITDPTGAAINYNLNGVGRPISVTGSSFGGVTTYASDLQYKASGVIKHMNYPNGRVMDQTYTQTLRPLHFEIPGIMAKDYEYHPDGRIRYSADLRDNRFDRSYSYDHVGRVTNALSGPAARGLTDTANRPYRETYFYDAFGHLTGRFARIWNAPGGPFDAGGDYVNNRATGWKYDANGNITASSNEQFTYDAAGRSITTVSNSGNRTDNRTMDGDGIEVKRVDADFDQGTTTTYNVYSSVLGRNITELNELGQKTRTFVYLNDEVLAQQHRSGSTDWVLWEYRDPSNATYMEVSVPGNPVKRSELDPSGADAGTTTPSGPRPVSGEDLTYPAFADLFSGQCVLDGIAAPCGVTSQLLRSGAGVEAESSIASGLKRRKKKPSEPTFPNPKDNPKDPSDVDPILTRTAPTLMIRAGTIMIQEKQISEFERGGHKRQRPRTFNFWEDLPILIGPEPKSPQEAIDDAVADALLVLKPEGELGAENSCARFFGGSREATEVLNGLAKLLKPGLLTNKTGGLNTTIGIHMTKFGTNLNAETGQQYRLPLPGSAIVNTSGPFFRISKFGSFVSNSRAGRALAILHELAHLIKVANGSVLDKNGNQTNYSIWKIPDDGGGDDDQSLRNTDEVEAACRDQLKALNAQ